MELNFIERDIRTLIRFRIEDKFESISAFARAAGLPRNRVSEYVGGKSDIKFSTLLIYLFYLDLTMTVQGLKEIDTVVIDPPRILKHIIADLPIK